MLRLLACAALLAAFVISQPCAHAQEETASQEAGGSNAGPVGWREKELPRGGWIVLLKILHDGELHRELEQKFQLDSPQPDSLYCDYIARDYVEGDSFIPAWQVRNFVWVLPAAQREELLAGEPWLAREWPQGMTKAAFERLLDKAALLQAGELCIYTYSDAGDDIELDIKRQENHYSIEALASPGLPLAGSLLEKVEVVREWSDYALFSLRLPPAGLGFLDAEGHSVILPQVDSETRVEARQ